MSPYSKGPLKYSHKTTPMNGRRTALPPLQLLLPLLLAAPSPAEPAPELEESLRRTVTALSAPESRMTGYPGIAEAADWLTAELEAMGIAEIHRHEFPVPVPVDEGFHLQAGGESLRLFGVWPNLARTPALPAGGLEGPLVAGGDGRALEGQPVAGRIVLLDYASARAWVDAFDLGAAAVVLLESPGAHRKEAELKFLDVPADLPRLYAPAPEADRLRQLAREGAHVRLSGRMTWRQATGRNLVAVVEGRDPALRGEAVLLTAYYDAVSPVPALAPGAEQASSAAALLELARRLAVQPPARTVVLLWTSGHFQNLAGMRHFTPLLLQAAGRREDPTEDSPLLRRLSGLDLRFLAGLDLSARSSRLGVFRPRDPYRTSLLAPPVTARVLELAAAYEDSAAGGAPLLVNGLKPDLSRQGLGGLALTVPLDASVAALAGCPSLSFVTVNDSRAGFDSPTDLPEQVDCAGLARQVGLLAHLLEGLAGDPQLPDWAWGDDAFGTVHGEVVHYGPRSYLPDQPTAGALVRVRLRQPTLAGGAARLLGGGRRLGPLPHPGAGVGHHLHPAGAPGGLRAGPGDGSRDPGPGLGRQRRAPAAREGPDQADGRRGGGGADRHGAAAGDGPVLPLRPAQPADPGAAAGDRRRPGGGAPRLRRLPAPDPAGDGALQLPQPRRLLDRAGGRALRAAGDPLQGGHVQRALRPGAPAAAAQRVAGGARRHRVRRRRRGPAATDRPPGGRRHARPQRRAHRRPAAPRGAQRPPRRLPRALRGASRGGQGSARRLAAPRLADRARRAWAWRRRPTARWRRRVPASCRAPSSCWRR